MDPVLCVAGDTHKVIYTELLGKGLQYMCTSRIVNDPTSSLSQADESEMEKWSAEKKARLWFCF